LHAFWQRISFNKNSTIKYALRIKVEDRWGRNDIDYRILRRAKMSKPHSKAHNQQGFSLVELLIVIVILGILSTLSILYLVSSRRAANGASAVASLRVVSQAQTTYSAGVGNKNYGNPIDLFRQDLIDSGLARACNPVIPVDTRSVSNLPALPAAAKSGYIFEFSVIPQDPTTTSSFAILAKPLIGSGNARSGDHTYYLDQTGVIRLSEDSAQIADINSSPLNN
jgi:prepilin-type N-terminal cleavage/methylation domain-containing protein